MSQHIKTFSGRLRLVLTSISVALALAILFAPSIEAIIHTDAIIARHIASNSITTDKLAANSVTTDKLNAGAVTAAKINVGSLDAISANFGTMTSGTISGVTINGGVINIGAGNFTVDSAGILFLGGPTVVDATLSVDNLEVTPMAGGGTRAVCVDNGGFLFAASSC